MRKHLARYHERLAARREAVQLVERYGERACGLALDWLATLPKHEQRYHRLVVIAVAQRQGCRALGLVLGDDAGVQRAGLVGDSPAAPMATCGLVPGQSLRMARFG